MVLGKLRLDSEAAVLRGGVSGPAIRARQQRSKPAGQAHSGADVLRMPMSGAIRFPANKVQLIRSWRLTTFRSAMRVIKTS